MQDQCHTHIKNLGAQVTTADQPFAFNPICLLTSTLAAAAAAAAAAGAARAPPYHRVVRHLHLLQGYKPPLRPVGGAVKLLEAGMLDPSFGKPCTFGLVILYLANKKKTYMLAFWSRILRKMPPNDSYQQRANWRP